MDKKVNVSIIIPSYQVARYMEQCLNSIVNQTLKDIEIICVDAQSADGTLDIIQEYAKKDARLKLVISDQKSYGYQMNLGLRIASGKYIGIVESDDWADKEMFERLFLEAEKNEAEIVKANYYRYSTKNGIRDEFYEALGGLPYGVVFHPEKYKKILMLTPGIWAGIYKKSFLDEHAIRFLESPGASFQDTGFILKCLVCASRVLLLKDAFLHYRIDNANSSVKSGDKVYCICDEFDEVERFLEERPVLSDKYFQDIWAVRCQRYCWNFYRISMELKHKFLKRMAVDFQGAKEKGFLVEKLYSTHNWKFLQMLLKDFQMAADYFCLEPLVSVIVFPGSGKAYEECLESLEHQTIAGIEIIKLEICSGQVEGQDVNEAILKARGKYLIFADQHVVYKSDMLEKCFKRAFATGADLIVMNGRFHFGNLDKLEPNHTYLRSLPAARTEGLFDLCDRKDDILSFTVPSLCNRMYKKSCLMDLEPEWFENLIFFQYGSLYHTSQAACLDEILLNRTETVYPVADLILRILEQLEAFYTYFQQKKEFFKYEKSFCISVADTVFLLLESISSDSDRITTMQYLSRSLFLQSEILNHEPDFYNHAKVCVLRLGGIQRALQVRNNLEQLQAAQYEIMIKADDQDFKARVSVVIPVYNAENYISECLDSICSQTLREIEIICIDDGSTDGSLKILKEYAKQDERVMVIHQPNYKLSIARNVGVQLSTGEYLFFIDSDDKLDAEALAVLYHRALRDQLDVVYFNSKVFRDSKDAELMQLCISYENFYNRKGNYSGIYTGADLFKLMQENGDYLSSPCLQFVSREHFITNGLWFEPGIYHEDEIYGLKSILCAKRAGYAEEKLYERRIRKNSIVSAKKEFDHAYGRFVCYKRIMEMLSEMQLDDFARQYGYRVACRMLASARLNWSQLDEAEQFVYYALPDAVRTEFRVLVNEWGKERSKLTANQKWYQNEKKERIRLKDELNLLKKARNEEKVKYQQDKQSMEQKNQQDKVLLNQEINRLKNKIDHIYNNQIRSLLKLAHATGKKAGLWGCGKIGMEILEKMAQEQISVDFLIDQDPLKNHQKVHGYVIYAFEEVKDQVDIVLAASHKYIESIQAMAEGRMVIDLTG